MSLEIRVNNKGEITLSLKSLYIFYNREDYSSTTTRFGTYNTDSYMLNNNYFLRLTS